MRKSSRFLTGDRGFALLVVLWTVALLAMVATQLLASGSAEARLASNLRDATSVEAAADGAVAEAVFHALDSSERHWRANGAAHAMRQASATAEVRIDNEAAKVDLNSAPPELVAALLHAVGADTQSAAALSVAVAEWRFADSRRGDAAKLDAYRAAGRSYAPPGAPFRSLGELGLVLGMTPELLARLTPHLTIFHEGEPDFRIANPVVRQAMREAGGEADRDAPAGSFSLPEESVVTVTAVASGARGARFTRRAVVRLGMRRQGQLYEVLAWDSVQE